MSAVIELGDLIAKLTPSDAAELKTYLKERFRVEPAVAFAPPIDDADDPVVIGPLPTAFDVLLEAVDPTRKIAVIKAVRELTGRGLAESKGLVETLPKRVAEGVDQTAADALRAKLTDAGATVSVRGA